LSPRKDIIDVIDDVIGVIDDVIGVNVGVIGRQIYIKTCFSIKQLAQN
jgi:hypothetical protein